MAGEKPQGKEDFLPMPFTGACGRTRRRTIHVGCDCGHSTITEVYDSVNAQDVPTVVERFLGGDLHDVVCPVCGRKQAVDVPIIFHDPRIPVLVIAIPDAQRARELELREALLQRLIQGKAGVPDYVKRVEVVFTRPDLRRILATPPVLLRAGARAEEERELATRRADLERREGEVLAREEDLLDRADKIVVANDKLRESREALDAERAELERERQGLRALSIDLTAREGSLRERSKVRRSPPALPSEVSGRAKKASHAAQDPKASEADKAPPAAKAPQGGKADKGPKAQEGGKAPKADKVPSAGKASKGQDVPVAAEASLFAGADDSVTTQEFAKHTADGLGLASPSPRPQEEVDRWGASGKPMGAISHGAELFLLARIGEVPKALREREPHLLVQLHVVEDYPLVVFVAQPGEAPGVAAAGDADAAKDLSFWTLDPRDDADREALEGLGESFVVHVDIYDEESRVVARWDVREPLENNVRVILERVDAALDASGRSRLDVHLARAAFEDWGNDKRLGRKQHNFSEESFVDLPSPAAARLALGIVSYWSEADNETYLLLTKSFPAVYWNALRDRVVRRALDFGLRLPPDLVTFAEREGIIESRSQALRVALASFAEVALRLKASDLEPAQEWDNWRQLLADCVDAGVTVEPQIKELAASCARKVQDMTLPAEDETQPGGDLSLLSDDELLPLLKERDQRRDVALEICDRGDPRYVEQIFAALRNMTRDEVARVIPAMLQFGPEGLPLFVQGLGHRKSFLRQGCALALGSIRAPAAAEALVEFLLREPTRIWMEAARAIGDLGTVAVARLGEAIESADGEGRERLAWALAHVSLNEEGKAAVLERVGGSPAAGAKKVAWRALQMLDYVRKNDQEVRGHKPLSDQTIVRRFTRHFFESKADEVKELSDDDIVEQEEEVGDVDILDAQVLDSQDQLRRSAVLEAVEVDDDDIVEP